MLKKNKIMKIIVAFVFSVLLFGANFIATGARQAFAEPSQAPNLDVNNEGDSWDFDGSVLSLRGVEWVGSLSLEGNSGIETIDLVGTNSIVGDETGEPIISLSSVNVKITGSGTLELGNEGDTEFADTILFAEGGETLSFDGHCLIQKNGVEEIDLYDSSLTADDLENANYVKFEPSVSENQDNNQAHEHVFEYLSQGATLSATCTAGDCTLDVNPVSATLVVEDIEFGETLVPSMNFSAFSEVNPSLSLDSATKTYYKTDAKGSVDGGTVVDETPSEAGYYYLKATFSGLEAEDISVVSAFEIKAIQVENISVSAVSPSTTVSYLSLENGHFDISTLFNFVGCDELTKTYYLIDGQTATRLHANIYSVSVASYNFRVVVTNAQGVELAQCEATLIVEKSQLSITVNHFEWSYGENPNPVVQGYAPSSAISYEYFLDSAYSQAVDGVPTEVGAYYVVVNVRETLTTLATSTTTTCEIKPKLITINWALNNFTYNGRIQTVSATYKDKDMQDVELIVSFDDEFKDAKTYVATASFKNGETSYSLPAEVTKEYTIRQREITVGISNRKIYYGEDLVALNARVISGTVADGDELPYQLKCDIPESKDMGRYTIYGLPVDSNYDITFVEGEYLILNKITSLTIQSWVYGEQASVPQITAHYGADKVVYTYSNRDGYLSNEVPTEPGFYFLTATISDDEEYYCATVMDRMFSILKIVVTKPAEDQTSFVYDGQYKTYNIIGENEFYSVTGAEQRDAGTYKVIVSLNDTVHYRWNVTDLESVEYIFTIQKKTVEKPVSDNRTFKFTGNNQVYFVQESAEYEISGNIQSNIGTHKVRVELVDKANTCWEDGSSSDIVFEFVIRQAELTNPNTVSTSGELIESKPVVVTGTDSKGLDPNANLNVVVINASDKSEIKELKKVLSEHLTKYETIFKAYDVDLKIGDVEVQPDGRITLKIEIPEELLESNFKIYHVHTDANGQKIISKVETAGAHELGFVVVQTDKLSEFVFVYEQESLSALIITFAIISVILLVGLALQLFFYLKICKKSLKSGSKTLMAIAPAVFVGSEVAWSIILGVLSVLLLAGNIVLGILILKKLPKKEKNKKSEEKEADEQSQKAIDMSKTKEKEDKKEKKADASKTSKKTQLSTKKTKVSEDKN